MITFLLLAPVAAISATPLARSPAQQLAYQDMELQMLVCLDLCLGILAAPVRAEESKTDRRVSMRSLWLQAPECSPYAPGARVATSPRLPT
ncbi:MAG: hypothetical protein NTW87_13005 [Planctomycetota bacterium]|nr:hypothetical protein [Planctomycetota bacterium]